jgi:hypothetical protein
MENYVPLLLQLRLLADQHGDKRSLVAICAQFEREADEQLTALHKSIKQKAHCRNGK